MHHSAANQRDLPEAAFDQKRRTRRNAGTPQRRGLSIKEFCDTYGIGRSQAYIEIGKGRLRIRKIGRRTVVAVDDAEAWFAACAVEPTAA